MQLFNKIQRWLDHRFAMTYLFYLAKGILVFSLVYGFANWVSSYRIDQFHLYMNWEKQIPVVPEFMWIYASLILMLFVPMFLISRAELEKLYNAFTFSILIAGAIFLIFPGQMGYDRLDSLSTEAAGAFEFLFYWDKPHNLYPSLHITIGFLMTRFSWIHLKTGGRTIMGIWYVLMTLSVLLVHQHHVIDIISGLILGETAFQRFSPRAVQMPAKVQSSDQVYDRRWQTSY